jgi:hypothetical protein
MVQIFLFPQPISGVIAIVIAITVRHIVSISTQGNATSTAARLHGHFASIIGHLRRSHAERLVVIGLICVILFSVSFAITLRTTPLMELFREEADIRY